MTISIKHWDETEPYAYRVPKDFDRFDRFQVIAVEDDHAIVGRWRYFPQLSSRSIRLDSSHTWVSGRVRRQGIALRMWMAGVDRWDPDRITASIATWNGAALLARVAVELAGRVEIRIDANDWLPTYHMLLAETAMRALERLRKTAAPKLEVVA